MKGIEFVLPEEIEKRSFEIIGQELKERGIRLNPAEESVTKRVIIQARILSMRIHYATLKMRWRSQRNLSGTGRIS